MTRNIIAASFLEQVGAGVSTAIKFFIVTLIFLMRKNSCVFFQARGAARKHLGGFFFRPKHAFLLHPKVDTRQDPTEEVHRAQNEFLMQETNYNNNNNKLKIGS